MKNKELKFIIIAGIVIGILIGIYFLLSSLFKEEIVDEPYLKNYGANEYIPTYVSADAMAKIYLNDYISTMYFNPNQAYKLLDKDYRTKKFGSLENYKNYILSLPYSNYEIFKYKIEDIDGYQIFEIYDKNNNFYAFKTKGVMQYTVYLDDYTVEIG